MTDAASVVVRPMVEADLADADRIFRVAFGTFLGLPRPEDFAGDADLVRGRWKADPAAALAAEVDGRLVGSNCATSWGSVGFFGPLTVEPARWDQGVARSLLDATMEIFAAWGTRHVGLFTFAHSAKHVSLYQRYGFWPRFLTAVMSRPVDPAAARVGARVSEEAASELTSVISSLRELAGAVYPGLDVSREILAVRAQELGDTVLVDDAGLQAMAVCHVGAGTEGGSGNCYVKFGAVRPGPHAARNFGLLIDACHALAAERGASVLIAGANAGRDRAWASLVERGFRSDMQGVAMHRPNEAGYSTSDSYVIDDWR